MVVKLQVIFAFSKFLQSKLLLFDNKKKAKYINVCVCQLLNCVTLFETPWTIAHQPTLSIGFSKQEQWSGQPFPSPKVFPTQGLNLGLLHCRQTLYHLSHQGSPIKKVLSKCQSLSCALCDPMDCSPPGSSVHEIFQARILEWVAIKKILLF